jgi:hypothetical protein
MADPRPGRSRAIHRLELSGNDPSPGLADQPIRGGGVGTVGVVTEHVVGPLPALPATDDEKMSRIIEVLQKLVAEVAVVPNHVDPYLLGDLSPFFCNLRLEM